MTGENIVQSARQSFRRSTLTDRSKQLADDPYLETREKEDAFLSRIEDTISRSLQSCTPVSLGGILQLMQSAQPAAALVSEETEEDISAALDFADGF